MSQNRAERRLLALSLRRRIGAFRGYGVVSTCLKMFAVSAVMGVFCTGLHSWLERSFSGGGLAGEIARLATTIVAGMVVVVLGARALGVREARMLSLRRDDESSML